MTPKGEKQAEEAGRILLGEGYKFDFAESELRVDLSMREEKH